MASAALRLSVQRLAMATLSREKRKRLNATTVLSKPKAKPHNTVNFPPKSGTKMATTENF